MHDIRLEDVSKVAGVSRQAIYLHFTTREDLGLPPKRYRAAILASARGALIDVR